MPGRKIAACLLLALCVCFLFGCTEKQPNNSTASASTVSTFAPTEPEMPEPLVYFSNMLELNRLYSCRYDGTSAELVLDQVCTDPAVFGDYIYCIGDGGLLSIDRSTAETETIQKDAIQFCIDENILVYAGKPGDDGTQTLSCIDLTTGKEALVSDKLIGSFAAKNGRIYYSIYDSDVGGYAFCMSRIDEEGAEVTYCGDYFSYSHLATDHGAYARMTINAEEVWAFVSAEDNTITPVEGLAEGGNDLVYENENGLYYVNWSYGSVQYSLHLLSPNGVDTVLYSAKPDWNLDCTPVGNGTFLLETNAFVGWGAEDEWGYRENYAWQAEYLLLQNDGTLMPIDARGTCGKMFEVGDFPLIDSSTARKPVTTALYELFVKNYDYTGAEPLCSTTHGAWLNIADRKVDLAFLAAPTQEEQDYLRQRGVDIEMKLYGGDGLVFIGNAQNPVTDLSHEQIIGIYTGEITNWKELGGPDHPISVYYRDDQSGSQRLFESLVFKGLDAPDYEALGFNREDEMSSIIGMVQYDPYAIGYSIMTYLDSVYEYEDVKVFALNGVAPSPNSIADSTYRYHTKGYIVIRADELEDSPARRLFNWFGCTMSDELLTRCSVTPLSE